MRIRYLPIPGLLVVPDTNKASELVRAFEVLHPLLIDVAYSAQEARDLLESRKYRFTVIDGADFGMVSEVLDSKTANGFNAGMRTAIIFEELEVPEYVASLRSLAADYVVPGPTDRKSAVELAKFLCYILLGVLYA